MLFIVRRLPSYWARACVASWEGGRGGQTGESARMASSSVMETGENGVKAAMRVGCAGEQEIMVVEDCIPDVVAIVVSSLRGIWGLPNLRRQSCEMVEHTKKMEYHFYGTPTVHFTVCQCQRLSCFFVVPSLRSQQLNSMPTV